MAMAEQDEKQVSKTLRRSERSKTLLRPPSPDKHEIEGKNKGYKLNRQNALSKKIDKCKSKHIEVNLKAGNLYIELSTAAYGVFRTKLKTCLFTTPFNKAYHATRHQSHEEKGLQVEDIYKIYKKPDGTYGKQSKCTINSYRTNNSILVNGSEINIFTENILEPIQEFIQQTQPALDELNRSMAETMKLTITAACNVQNEEIENINHKDKAAPSNKEIDKNPKPQDNEFDKDEDQQNENSYKCPICREESENNTIACDECNEWFHYTCLKLTEMEIRKIDPDIPYICDLCNDEALFMSTITKSDRDSNQHQASNQQPSKFVKLQQQPTNAIVIEDKSENNETRQTTNLDLPIIELDNDEGTQSALYRAENNIIRETKQRTASLEQKHTQMDSNNPEGESDIMNRPSRHQIEEQTSVKQPLENASVNAYENNRNIDKQNQKQPVKKSSMKNQQNRKFELEQIAYISSLEQRIKNQDKTIDLLKKNMEIMQNNGQPTDNINNMNRQPNIEQGNPNRSNIDQMRDELEKQIRQEMQGQMMEMRLKQLESQMVQFMCLNTSITTQMMIQSQKDPTHSHRGEIHNDNYNQLQHHHAMEQSRIYQELRPSQFRQNDPRWYNSGQNDPRWYGSGQNQQQTDPQGYNSRQNQHQTDPRVYNYGHSQHQTDPRGYISEQLGQYP
ncbi:unnamed protein product [Mytilus edulis]|uniref:PHD-type domain-containing protein n=1 Tax=Mytilus edulis TaxID=6550 RepID=A0A8S3S8M7_MYTED|nr:unnamed protein product [Mytilus edulis]